MDCSGLRTLVEASSRCTELRCQLSPLPCMHHSELTSTPDSFLFDD